MTTPDPADYAAAIRQAMGMVPPGTADPVAWVADLLGITPAQVQDVLSPVLNPHGYWDGWFHLGMQPEDE